MLTLSIVVGHGIQFFNNIQALFEKGVRYYGDREKPFQLYVAGQRMLVVNSPRLVDQVVADNSTFTFDPFIRDLYDGLVQMSAQGQEIMWKKPEEGYKALAPNPKGKVLVHIGLDLLHKQLLQPDCMTDLFNTSFNEMRRLLDWDSANRFGIMNETPDVRVASLYRWVRDLLIRAQADTFFGPEINEMEPNLARLWDNWSLNSWMLSYGYPAFLTTSVTEPRDRMIKVVTDFMNIPFSERRGGTPFVRELETEMRHAGLAQEDCAKVLVIILSSINSNLYLSTFWLLSYVLSIPGLAAEIRKEVLAELEKQGPLTEGSLESRITREFVDRCGLLRSCFNETIRVASTGCTVRKVSRNTVLEGKTVHKGTIVFMPQRSLLLNKEAWGPDAQQMNPYRFLQNKKLERSEFFRPFGSGVTLCSGRIIGRHQILAFVALALLRFDIDVVKPSEEVMGVKGKPFPKVDDAKPSLGVSTQAKGDDLVIKVSRRKHLA